MDRYGALMRRIRAARAQGDEDRTQRLVERLHVSLNEERDEERTPDLASGTRQAVRSE